MSVEKKQRVGIIYKATNLVNKKRYVGQTTNTLEGRMRGHFNAALRYASTYVFHCAIRKYGVQSFKFEIIEQCTLDALYEKEKYWIEKLKTCGPRGYNALPAGNKFTEETYEKWTAAMARRVFTQETRDKLSKAHKGRVLTSEHCTKISAAKTGVKRPNMTGKKHPMYGKPSPMRGRNLTAEQRAKISAVPSEVRAVASRARWAKPGAREKWSKRMSGANHPMYGVLNPTKGTKRDPEIGRKISASKMGHVVSDAARENMRQAALRRYERLREAQVIQ